MTQVRQRTVGDELHLSVKNEEGLCVRDMFKFYERMMKLNPDAPVSLCLQEVETYTTRIVAVCNEGDNSTVWIKLDRDLSDTLARKLYED